MARVRIDLAQGGAHVVAQFLDPLVTINRVFGERAINDRLQGCEGGRVFAAFFGERLRRAVQDRVAHLNSRLALKGPDAGEHLVEQHAHGKNVGAMINQVAACLLRRGGSRRAVRHAHFRQVRLMYAFGARGRVVQQLRQAKVEHLSLPVVGNHHVAGFDVAVDDAACVGGGEGVRNLQGDGERGAQLKRLAVHQFAHVPPFDVLHGDEVDAVRFAEIEDGANVRMVERRGKACFALEAFEARFARGQLRRQDFEHDRAPKLRIERLIDSALSARADLFDDLVLEQLPVFHISTSPVQTESADRTPG